MTGSTTLAHLAHVVGGTVVGDGGLVISDVQHDSRNAGPGDLFVAVRGLTVDGHEFTARAASAGAALCVDHELPIPAPQLVVADTRRALGPLAAAVHGRPAEHLTLIGITGTNGKTTVAHFLESIVSASGRRPGLAGTLGARIDGDPVPLSRTTPEASDLQRLLGAMVAAGVDIAVIEVSSHALTLARVDGLVFDVAAFTNLSQDHLDFHGDMETYFAAKGALFGRDRSRRAVVWADGPWGRRMLWEHVAGPVATVGMTPEAEVHAGQVKAELDGSSFDIVTPEGVRSVRINLPGDFNIANALVAAACARAVGLDGDAVAAGLGAVATVPGRFEPIRRAGAPSVIVDYAHTPAGIEAVVASARRLEHERLVVVIGAGGDRDRDKREHMGRAAAAGDVVVVTSDNPRSEDPVAIVDAVASGARGESAQVMTEPDRRRAIRLALRTAGVGDLVLLLGRGHETGQEIAGAIVPFDDRVVAREELAAL